MASSTVYREPKFSLVAAIDFGTTFTGYAYSFVPTEDQPRRHEDIRMNKNWGSSYGMEVSSAFITVNPAFLCINNNIEFSFAVSENADERFDEQCWGVAGVRV